MFSIVLTQNLNLPSPKQKKPKKEGPATNRIPMFQNTPRCHRRRHSQMPEFMCHSEANIMANFHKYQVREVRCNQSRNVMMPGTGILFFCKFVTEVCLMDMFVKCLDQAEGRSKNNK
ncbi:hypothetical protein CDAR_41281 [Caerostris darwini]|uniref:Uncharacterized protein n=1 Tax=Caerostris darwini TaxID=1538125 RepID=A0AAV4SN45_9ARAC|nr:hypothetical protein CDAR_41281 [Caerostris darwini]